MLVLLRTRWLTVTLKRWFALAWCHEAGLLTIQAGFVVLEIDTAAE